MTVPTSDNREEYTGNDSTTVFPYAFKIFENSDLEVYLQNPDGTETLLTLDTDYTVSGAGSVNGGNVTYPVSGDPLASDEKLIILRVIPIVQETDLRNQGAYYPQTLEDELDRSRMIDQQQQEEIDRSLKFPAAEDGYDADGRQIKNVADGTDDDDVLTKGQIDSKFANDVITQTAGRWDGKGKRATNFQTSNTPQNDELVNAQYLEAYVASVIAGGEGVIPETYFFDGDGSTTVFSTPGITALDPSSYTVTIDGIDQRPGTDYTVDVGSETVTFVEAPPVPFDGETDNVMIRVLAYKQAISDAQTALVDTDFGIKTVPETFNEALTAINNRVIRVGSVAEDFAGLTGIEGYQYSVNGWQSNTLYGGATYVFDSSAAKSLHDGGKYISPTVPAVSAQAGADFQARRDAFLAATGETDSGGSGVFVAVDELNESNYGAIGGGTVDDSKPLQGYFNSTEAIRTLPKAYLVTQAVTKIADNIDCQFGGTKFINGGPGWIFTFGEGSDTPIYEGLNVEGGKFEQQDPNTTENRNFILVLGTAEVSIRTKCKNVSNGGIRVEAGCERGSIDVKIDGISGYSTCRGVWLAGATASDYAGQLVDNTSITRNATPFPQFAVKDFSVTGKFKGQSYAIYAMNTRNCSVIGADIDISGPRALRCIAVNNYSPGFRVVGNTLTSDRSSTGVLVTQASDGVVIADNVFKGSFGGNRDIYVQDLSEATIRNNTFLTDTTQQIEIDLGGSADISDNYVNSPGGYVDFVRFVRIRTLGTGAGTGTIGDTATVLPGSVIKNNTVKNGRIVCDVDVQESAGGRNAGIESIVVKNNTCKDWDLVTTPQRPFTVSSSGLTYFVNYTYYDNDMFPANEANINSPSANGTGVREIRTDSQLAVFRLTVESGSVSSSKRYGSNFSCAGSLASNDLILSPRTIGGVSGAGIGDVFTIVDAGGNVASYRLTRSGSNVLVELLDSSGTQIPLSTTDATIDVVVSAKAS